MRYTKILLLCFLISGCDKEVKKNDTINSKIISHIKKEDWYGVSKLLNLHLNMKNSANIHIINGMVYDKLSNENPSYSGLSVVAYKKALNLDPNNLQASLAIGNYYLSEHDYTKAISAYAKVLMINDDNSEALYGMALACYATRNISLAKNCIDKLLQSEDDKFIYRLAALIYAAHNHPKAKYFANKFAILENDLYEIKYLHGRIADWKKTYARISSGKSVINNVEKNTNNSQVDPNQNIEIECVVLSFDERGSFSRGNNFLETLQEFKSNDEFAKGLSLRFDNDKNDSNGAAFYSNSRAKEYSYQNGKWILNPDDARKTITKGFSIGFDSIRYNLNILNSSSSIIDIISRPIIHVSAHEGKGEFESGDRKYMNTGGDVGSALSTIPSGVKLSIETNRIDLNNVMLMINLEIDKVKVNNEAGSLNDTAEVIYAHLNTQIQAKLNETIVIGGVYSNVNESSKSGVPGVQNMPLFDLVLANKNGYTSKKSVMMLLTPKSKENTKKSSEYNIDNMRNMILLKEHEPQFFKNKNNKEKAIKEQIYEYRREDIKLRKSNQNTDKIKEFVERI